MPFAGHRPDHRAGVELATIDAHRTAEAVTDLEPRLDDSVARKGAAEPVRNTCLCGAGAQGPQFYSDKMVRGSAITRRQSFALLALAGGLSHGLPCLLEGGAIPLGSRPSSVHVEWRLYKIVVLP
jgi:hypothetical protein